MKVYLLIFRDAPYNYIIFDTLVNFIKSLVNISLSIFIYILRMWDLKS